MSLRQSRWILWLAMALVVPVPVLALGPGSVPALRLLELAAISSAVMVVESSRGAVLLITLVLALQAVLWMGLFWGVAWLASRVLGRLSPRMVAGVTLGLVVAAVAVATSTDLYHTPFRAASARGDLLDVYK